MRPTPRSLEEAQLSAVHDFTPEPVEGVQALLVLSAENPAKADLVGKWQRLLGAGLIIAEVDGGEFRREVQHPGQICYESDAQREMVLSCQIIRI